jgi:hypothetical protein
MIIFMHLANSNYKMLAETHFIQQISKNSHLLVSLNQEVVQDKIKGWVTSVLIQQRGNLPIMKSQTQVHLTSLSQEP